MAKYNQNNCNDIFINATQNIMHEQKEGRGLLFVVSGPSGVGKGTLREKLFKYIKDLTYSVSVTTRAPRKDEKEGEDYYFVSKSVFEQMIKEDNFVEWAIVHDEYKGTPRQLLLKRLRMGLDVILEIDVQGAAQVKNKMPEGIFIFIAPPSWKDLEYRLRNRKTEKKEALEKRLTDAKTEIQCVDNYDYLVINDDINIALKQLESIVIAERCKINVKNLNRKEYIKHD